MRGHVYVLGVSILSLTTILLLGVGQRTVQSVWWFFSPCYCQFKCKVCWITAEICLAVYVNLDKCVVLQ